METNGNILAPAESQETGNRHLTASLKDEKKISLITDHFKSILQILGVDTEKETNARTPYRVAKMYVKDLFAGLNEQNEPVISTTPNTHSYREIIIEKNIRIFSLCEHHLMPLVGKLHLAYIPNDKIIPAQGLKQIVGYYSKRPQSPVQLTMAISEAMKKWLGTRDVAVLLESVQVCSEWEYTADPGRETLTAQYSGRFQNEDKKREFLSFIKRSS